MQVVAGPWTDATPSDHSDARVTREGGQGSPGWELVNRGVKPAVGPMGTTATKTWAWAKGDPGQKQLT